MLDQAHLKLVCHHETSVPSLKFNIVKLFFYDSIHFHTEKITVAHEMINYAHWGEGTLVLLPWLPFI